jgi:hypothetical protein
MTLRAAEDLGWNFTRGVLLFLATFMFVAKFLLMWVNTDD